MKKILLFLLGIMFLSFPLIAKADDDLCDTSNSSALDSNGYCYFPRRAMGWYSGNASKYSVNNITYYTYSINGLNSPVFCIDHSQLDPKYVDMARKLNPKNVSHNLDLGLSTIYKMYLLEGGSTAALVAANDAMRMFVSRSEHAFQLYSSYWYAYDTNLINLANQLSTTTGYSSNNKILDQRFYCAGRKATGYEDGSYAGCNQALRGYDLDVLKLSDFSFNIIENKDVERVTVEKDFFSQTITVIPNGTGYENIKKTLETYPQLKNASHIILSGCSVDSNSKSKGFSCALYANNQDLLSGKAKIVVKNTKKVEESTNVKVTVSYKYQIPFDANNLTMVRYSQKVGTQRFIVVDKDKIISSELDISIKVTKTCDTRDGKYYIPGHIAPVSKAEYDAICSPCYLDLKNNKYYYKGVVFTKKDDNNPSAKTLEELLDKTGDYKCCNDENVVKLLTKKKKDASGADADAYEQNAYTKVCTNTSLICKENNGKYYCSDGGECTQEDYEIDCLSCKTDNNKYYCKNGKLCNKSDYESQCLCRIEKDSKGNHFYNKDNIYTVQSFFSKDGADCCTINDTSGLTDSEKKVYKDTCCRIEDGKYYIPGNANPVDKSTYDAVCTPNIVIKQCRVDFSDSNNHKYYFGDNSYNLETFLNGEPKCCEQSKDYLTGSNATAIEKQNWNKYCNSVCSYDSEKQTFFSKGQNVGFEKFVGLRDENGNECCLKFIDDAKSGKLILSRSEINYLNEHTNTAKCKGLNPPPACEVKNGKYYVNGMERRVEEYIADGCCKDVAPADLKTGGEAEQLYNKLCKSSDIVEIGNKCGTTTKEEFKKIVDANGEDVIVKSCTNDSYVDYNKSIIHQTPLKNAENGVMSVIDKVNYLEKSSAYSENLTELYSSPAISNYLDKSYLQKEIEYEYKGKKDIYKVDNNNPYCMLYTSEENDFYSPGTAVASSGRYFIFKELNDSNCTGMNLGSNCFRQPYIEGRINLTMHTNFAQWESDYLSAIKAEEEAYTSKDVDEDSMNLYIIARDYRQKLEQYKLACQAHNQLAGNWVYSMNPELKFSYQQDVYDGNKKADELVTNVPMSISTEKAKYWPNVSTNVSYIPNSSTGTENLKDYSTGFQADTTTDYSIAYKQTLYYKPEKAAYADLITGRVLAYETPYQTSANVHEGDLLVGYVFDVNLTTYAGIYSTSFILNNIGHGKNSNLQNVLKKYLDDHNITSFDSKCHYCDTQSAFKPQCKSCDEKEKLKPTYIYRTISLSDVTPNDRTNTNWSDDKGTAAEKAIQQKSGSNIISMLSTSEDKSDARVVTLDESSTKNLKVQSIANDIYDDSSKEFLEYEFELTTKDMQMIKKSNNSGHDHAAIKMCKTGKNGATDYQNHIIKQTDDEYCYVCNSDGKECKSSFVEAFAVKNDGLLGRNKYKYYINKVWEINTTWQDLAKNGKLDLEGFTDKKYPDPDNQEAFIEKYSNWP